MDWMQTHWTTRTVLIELLTVLAGLASVLLYNRLYDASISPLLGAVVGVINATLVGWCMEHGTVARTQGGGYLTETDDVTT